MECEQVAASAREQRGASPEPLPYDCLKRKKYVPGSGKDCVGTRRGPVQPLPRTTLAGSWPGKVRNLRS